MKKDLLKDHSSTYTVSKAHIFIDTIQRLNYFENKNTKFYS